MRELFSVADLEAFVVQAKQHTYVGGAKRLLPYRLGSKDIQYASGDWAYHDSYLGESDFIGQEVVYFQKSPVWAMNYFGYITKPERIDSHAAGLIIKASLSKMYAEGRFLGAFEHVQDDLRYVDTNEGNVTLFQGKEFIYRQDEIVYELLYHGGLLKK
ncbi:DUF5680 domain-containing protein [Brevibacillus parabrevis]|uniref:DUF5680 domain-containing protein n=1 Tax=Brevibacillus parabrevis TaxID=54914 RepID=UPI002E211E97|nr:DUF5680 domain-containing protein [Brevibacillus parabrevis]